MDIEGKRGQTPQKKVRQEKIIPEAKETKPDRGLNGVKSKLIAEKLKSIDHFVYLYSKEGKYYLPPRKLITWSYIRQVLCGEKLLLKFERIGSQYPLPKAKGFNIGEFFQQMNSDTGFMVYFPDLSIKANVPRDYFLNVRLK